MRKRALHRSGLGLALLLQCLTRPSHAMACVVGTGTGVSCTESALNACLPGGGSFDGTVTFNCGGTATITVTSTKTISVDTTIDGGSLITISGGNSVGVFSVNTGVKFTVQNLTIANGKTTGGSGGGIFNDGTLTVTNSTFSSNSAAVGGGIYSYSTLTVTNSTFAGNGASYGGAIYSYGTLTVTNSTFASNSAGVGGAIENDGAGTLTVTNSTFSGNSAIDLGGGLYNSGYATLTVTNGTFSGNSAGGGGGIYSYGALTVTNTIVANSTLGGNCAGSVTDGGHNIDDGATCGFTGTGCTSTSGSSFCNTNPVLDPTGLQNNGGPTQTIALQVGSPAINDGDETVCAASPVNNLDQRGDVRPGAGATNCSIGAFEANASCGVNCPDGSSCTSSGQCIGGECDSTGSSPVCCGQTADCSVGTSCTADSQCRSGTCAGGVCAEPTNTPTATPTNTPTITPTPTNTPTITPTPTDTSTSTPTSTPTNTPTAILTSTPTATPTNTPTITPTPTNTLTITPTPTATSTSTPTATPTSTPTVTPTRTPRPQAPAITGGNVGGSTTITGSGIGAPGCTPGPVQVFDCGLDGICHDGDDFPLAVVSASVNNGNFIIVLVNPLVPGQEIYVIDGCHDPVLSLPVLVKRAAAVPLMSPDLIVALAAALGLLGLTRLRWSP